MNRIKGQVEAVDRMIDSGRDPIDIIQQIIAIKSCLNKIGKDLIKQESQECFTQVNEKERLLKFENLVKNFFKLSN